MTMKFSWRSTKASGQRRKGEGRSHRTGKVRIQIVCGWTWRPYLWIWIHKYVAKFMKTQKCQFHPEEIQLRWGRCSKQGEEVKCGNAEPDPIMATAVEIEIWKNQYWKADNRPFLKTTQGENIHLSTSSTHWHCKPSLENKMDSVIWKQIRTL